MKEKMTFEKSELGPGMDPSEMTKDEYLAMLDWVESGKNWVADQIILSVGMFLQRRFPPSCIHRVAPTPVTTAAASRPSFISNA